MRKFLKVLSVILSILLFASSIPAFAVEAEITLKTDFTNPEFYTDASGNRIKTTQNVYHAPVVEGDLDWSIVDDPDTTDVDEKKVYAKGVVSLVPGIEPIKVTNQFIAKTYAQGAQTTTNGGDYYNLAPAASQELDYRVPECEYYVVEDDDSIYITVRLIEKKTEDGAFITTGEHSVWIGFNPANYSQAIKISIAQHVATFTAGFNDSSSTKLMTLDTNDWLVTSIFGRYAYKTDGTEGNLNSYTNYRGQANPMFKYLNFEIDKEKIAYYWDELYDTDFYTSEGVYNLPNAMFLGVSSKASNTSDEIGEFCYAHGITSVPKSVVNNWGTKSVLLPDVIVFGDEREDGACADGCTFEMNVNDALRFTNDDGTAYYYTSCADCGTVGYKTFAKCEATGSHSYVDMPAKAATCIAPAISEHQYCTECGATEGGTTSGSPLRWVSGTVGTDYTYLPTYGQNFHVTGTAAVVSGDLNWTIVDNPDTAIDEKQANAKGVVSLVPGIKPIKVTNSYLANDYAASYQTTKVDNPYYNNAPLASQEGADDRIPDCEYYVVEDDNSIYITVRLVEKSWNGGTFSKDTRHSVWIGFNPDNYAQAVNLNLAMDAEAYSVVGFNDAPNTKMLKASSDDWLVNSIFARYSVGGNGSDGSFNSYKNYKNQTGTFVKYMSFEIDKEKIAKYWDELYGTDFYTREGAYNLPNTLFLGVSSKSFTVSDGSAAYCFTNGITSVPKADAETWGTYSVLLPDLIVLGDEKEIGGCNFVAHNTDAKYRVDGTIDTYYHSCTECGASGVRTFKADANGLVYEKEVAYDVESTVWDGDKAPTCTTSGLYIKSCSCGDIDPDTTNTFTVDPLGHKPDEDDDDCSTAILCTVCRAETTPAVEHSWNEATCTDAKTCSVCGKTEGEPNGHSWNEGVVTQDPTCSAVGVKTFTCIHNGEHTKTEEVAIDEDAHSWNAADCDTPKTCGLCGETDGDALGHSFEIEGKVATCSTCRHVCVHEFAEGADKCTHCEIEKAVVDACEHTATELVDGKAATCTETGLTAGTKCSSCGVIIDGQDTIPVDENAHAWNEGVVTQDSTCSAVGVKTFTCTHNGEHTKTEDVAIDEDAHSWNEGVVTQDPTCSAVGVKTFTCTHNGEHTKTEDVAIDKDAHSWNAADCDTPKTCGLCGETDGDALGHNFVATHNDTHHFEDCSKCDEIQNKAAHSYDDDNDATCNGCNYVREIEGNEPGGDGGESGGTIGSNSQQITTIGGSVNIEVHATYEKGETVIVETPVYSINITWVDISFEYNSSSENYAWDPDTLEYNKVLSTTDGWWTEHTATITIENRSNVAVVITARWEGEDGVDVTPVISAPVRLESAVGCVEQGRIGYITVSNPISGVITEDCKLGTIVLEITSAE